MLPVVVLGGGIGGLAAALALARRGRAVRVFEQGAEFKESAPESSSGRTSTGCSTRSG
jgi:2-polyprenyl-6-methoxyphenol hydroxylase-like FAD-dependent oxidoreductase